MPTDRDHGLSRAVTTWGLASSIVNAVVGAGIFAVPAAIAAATGSYAPFALLLCAVIIGSVAVCFAEGGSRIPTSGGPYGYIEFALGPFAGFIAGNLLWVGDLLASGGVSAALADTLAGHSLILHTAIIVVVLGSLAIVNCFGVVHGTRLAGVTTILKLIPLAIFVAAGATAVRAANLTGARATAPGGFGRAVLLGLYAFSGMETVLNISGEVRRPERTIPRALAIATLFTTVLYISIQFVAQGVLGTALPGSAAPLADAINRVNPALRLVILAGTAMAMFGFLSSDLLGTPRMIFAFARDGAMPRFLGRAHPRYRTPCVAIIFYAAAALLLAISGTFAELAVLSTLAAVVYYALGCIAAWLLARRKIALAGDPLDFRWLTPVLGIALAGMAAMIALAARAEIVGLAAFLTIVTVIHALMRRFRNADETRPASAP